MSKHLINKYAICDCYRHEDSQVIYCDGIKDGTVIHLAFADRRTALEYKKKFCRGSYEECPLHNLPRDEDAFWFDDYEEENNKPVKHLYMKATLKEDKRGQIKMEWEND